MDNIWLNNFYSIIFAQMQPKITFNTANTGRNTKYTLIAM